MQAGPLCSENRVMSDVCAANRPAKALSWEGRVSDLGGELPRRVSSCRTSERYTDRCRGLSNEYAEYGSVFVDAQTDVFGVIDRHGDHVDAAGRKG